MQQRSVPTNSTGLMAMDLALGGGWPPGSVVEIVADEEGLAPAMEGTTLVDNPAPATAISTAAVMLATGSVVVLYVGAGEQARDDAIEKATGYLAEHARRGGGTLLLVRKVPVTEAPRDDLLDDVMELEVRMRAEVDALCGGAAGPAITARVVHGGPVGSNAPMRFYVGHPLPEGLLDESETRDAGGA